MWKSLLENIQGIVLMVGLGFLALEDIKTHKIRSMSIIVFALVGAILSFLNGNWFDWRLILGFIPGIIVLFLGLLTKETIGYGDGLVVLALGCYLNIFEIIGLSMLALTLAGLAAVFLIVVYHKGKTLRLLYPETKFRDDLDLGLMYQDMYYMSEGYLWHQMERGNIDPDKMEKEYMAFLELWKKAYLKGEKDEVCN